jgi:hypothetical protein
MLKRLRHDFVHILWEKYRAASADMQPIEAALRQRNLHKIKQDHFAIIDLPGPHTGIPYLKEIFTCLGFMEQGKDYLAEKQNDFLWMCEEDSKELAAADVLPQVVVADFRLDEMPADIRAIIYKYSEQSQPTPLHDIQQLSARVTKGDSTVSGPLLKLLEQYFYGRDWPLPATKEFRTVQEFNELLAWVLIFGRRPNHFTLSVHLLDHFNSLTEFHEFIVNDVQLALNNEGGVIKGSKEIGIAQGSTVGITQTVRLADGEIQLPNGFVEFVWRFPRNGGDSKPVLWKDYFTGFIAGHADRVIESLYTAD